MTIKEIKDTSFAFNEITGEMICFLRNNMSMTLIMGDSHNPEVLCQLLFNDVQISESWSPMSSAKGIARLPVYRCNHI